MYRYMYFQNQLVFIYEELINVAKSGLVKYYPKSFLFSILKNKENHNSNTDFVAGFDSQCLNFDRKQDSTHSGFGGAIQTV